MRNLLMLLSICVLVSACGSDADFPLTITKAHFTGDNESNFYRVYGSYIHTSEGKFTTKMGKVLFKKHGNGLKFAFYLPTENDTFKLLQSPIEKTGVKSAVASNIENINYPLYKLKGDKKFIVYVENGVVIVKP